MNEIHRYIRNKHNQPRGIIVAVKTPEGDVRVSWSYCCRRDKFNKKFGLNVARARALNGVGKNVQTPAAVKRELPAIEDRAKRYFQTDNVRIIENMPASLVEVLLDMPSEHSAVENFTTESLNA